MIVFLLTMSEDDGYVEALTLHLDLTWTLDINTPFIYERVQDQQHMLFSQLSQLH